MISNRCVTNQKWALVACLLNVLVSVETVQAQDVTVLSEQVLSLEGLLEVKEQLSESIKENFPLLPAGLVYENLQGPFLITAACPSGYVEQAKYQFTSKVKVLVDEGKDCKGESDELCRAWQVSAEPEDDARYAFTMKLSCSSDDTVVLTQRVMNDEELMEMKQEIDAAKTR